MTQTLITGGAAGLGRETARQLLRVGHSVWIGDRDGSLGADAAAALGARFIELDVTDDESVAAAKRTLEQGDGLDVLINNAGIGGGYTPVAEVTPASVRETFETNVIGVLRMIRQFVPLLERSGNPVIVNVSSGMGSFNVTADAGRLESRLVGLAYPSSKAALNMLTVMYAKAYPRIRINAVDPGQTATAMTGGKGQSVERGAAPIVAAACYGENDPTGGFFDEAGMVPW